MISPPLTTRRAEQEVSVSGELDIATVPDLHRALDRVRRRGGDIALDVSGLEFVDLCGGRALLDAAAATARHGGVLTLVSPSQSVERILELMDAEHLIATR